MTKNTNYDNKIRRRSVLGAVSVGAAYGVMGSVSASKNKNREADLVELGIVNTVPDLENPDILSVDHNPVYRRTGPKKAEMLPTGIDRHREVIQNHKVVAKLGSTVEPVPVGIQKQDVSTIPITTTNQNQATAHLRLSKPISRPNISLTPTNNGVELHIGNEKYSLSEQGEFEFPMRETEVSANQVRFLDETVDNPRVPKHERAKKMVRDTVTIPVTGSVKLRYQTGVTFQDI